MKAIGRIIHAFLVVLAVAVATRGYGVAASQAPVPGSVPAEVSALKRISTQFETFARQTDPSTRNRGVTRDELARIQREADAVKRLLPELQRHVASAINKLKAAGKWDNALDRSVTEALKKIGKAAELQELQAAGGARRLLEVASTDTRDITADVDSQVDVLRKQIAWQPWHRWIGPALDAVLGEPVLAVYGGGARKVSLIMMVACLGNGIHGDYCGL